MMTVRKPSQSIELPTPFWSMFTPPTWLAARGRPNSMLTWEEASLATLCMFAAQESIRAGSPIDLRQFNEMISPESTS